MKWAIIFICWTSFALFFISQNYIIQAQSGRTIEWKMTLFNWLIGSYTWCVITPLILQLSNRFPLQRGKLLRVIGKEDLQRGAGSQTAPDEVNAKRPATTEEKPAKKASRLFERKRPANEKRAS